MFIRTLLIFIVAMGVSACGVMVPNYTPVYENVAQLDDVQNGSLKMGEFRSVKSNLRKIEVHIWCGILVNTVFNMLLISLACYNIHQ